MMIERAGAAGRFPSLARASNYLVDWPSGHTPYSWYGGYFHDYLAKTYGRESLNGSPTRSAAWPPYFGSLAFRRVFGKPLGDLWDEFARDYSPSATTASSRTRLTHHGFNVSAPWHSPDGRLFYLVANPHDFPALMEFSADKPRTITTQVNGGRLGGTNEEIIYDQVEDVRSVSLMSDLYAVNPGTRAVRRLTMYRRAADPHVSPDGKTITCIVQHPEGRALATLRMPVAGAVGVPETLSLDAGVDFAAPRWSPDGRRIAVERRVLGGPSEIVVVDATTGSIEHVARETPAARMSGPAWSPDGQTLLFAASHDGRPFEIHAMECVERQDSTAHQRRRFGPVPGHFTGRQDAGVRRLHARWIRPFFNGTCRGRLGACDRRDPGRGVRATDGRRSPLRPPWSPATTTHCAHLRHGSGRRFSNWTMSSCGRERRLRLWTHSADMRALRRSRVVDARAPELVRRLHLRPMAPHFLCERC